MSNTLNLAKLTREIAVKQVEQLDSGLAQYVESAIRLLEIQGKDITEYTLVKIDNPMQLKGDHSVRITSQWKIVKMSELGNLPIYEDGKLCPPQQLKM
jgi:hypothetical protein